MENLSPTEIAQRCLDSLDDIRPYLNRDVIIALKKLVRDQCYSDPKRTLEIAEVALAAAKMLDDPVALAWAMFSKGSALSFSQYPQQALLYYRQAEALFDEHEQWLPLLKIQAGLIYVLIRCGELEQALALADQARPHCHCLGEDGLQPLGLLEMNVGTLHSELGQFDLALQANERAMAAYTKLDATFDIARIQINSATFYMEMDQYQQAEIRYHEARQILEQIEPEPQELYVVDFNLGLLAEKLGHYQKALHYLEQARDGFIPEAHIALVDMNRATIYNILNLSLDALGLAQAAAQFYRQADIPDDLAQALHAQAVAWRGLGQLGMAHGALLEARQHFVNHGARREIALIDIALTELALENRNIDEARQLASRLSDIVDGDLWPNLAGEAYLLQARVLLSTSQLEAIPTQSELDRANKALQQARRFTEKYPQPKLMISLYHQLSQLYIAQQEPRSAWAALCQAIAYLETLRDNLLLDEFRIGFMDEQHEIYLHGLQLLQSHVPLDIDKDGETAQQQVMFYLLNRAATAPLSQVHVGNEPDPALNQELQDLRALWHWLQAKLEESQSEENITEDELLEIATALAETESRIADLGRRLGVRSGWQGPTMPLSIVHADFVEEEQNRMVADERFADQFQDQAIKFCDEMQQKLAPHEALLHYFVMDQQVYIFLINNDEMCYLPLGSTAPIEQFQQNWEHHLQDAQLIADAPAVANKIATRLLSLPGQVLIEPILDRLADTTHLYLIYPPSWHEIPFAALRTTGGYLVERCQVTHLSTPEALLQQNITVRSPKPAEGTPHALILGYSEGGTLPHNLYESHQVQQTLAQSGWQTTLLLEENATLASLYSAAGKSQLLHLATHAFFQPENPLFSWARLADSQLTVADIYHQTPLLNQALVVLSACETGRGQVRGGGLLGMARALLVSGAHSLVVSLWPVEDQATAQLMESFYRQMDTPDLTMTSSHLCQAQREQATTQHPFYWAGFIYIGG